MAKCKRWNFREAWLQGKVALVYGTVFFAHVMNYLGMLQVVSCKVSVGGRYRQHLLP